MPLAFDCLHSTRLALWLGCHVARQLQTSRQGALATPGIPAEVMPASRVFAGGAAAVGDEEHVTETATTQHPGRPARLAQQRAEELQRPGTREQGTG